MLEPYRFEPKRVRDVAERAHSGVLAKDVK